MLSDTDTSTSNHKPTAQEILKAAGMTGMEYGRLYDAIESALPSLAINIAHAFVALRDAGATIQDHKNLFAEIRHACEYPERLPGALVLLREGGATIEDHQLIYQTTISSLHSADRFPALFSLLKQEGLTMKDHPLIYSSAMIRIQDINTIPLAFEVLRAIGATIQAHERLVRTLIVNSRYAQELATTFLSLKAVGITLENSYTIYEIISESSVSAHKFTALIEILKKEGATFPDCLPLYEIMIRIIRRANIDNISDVFATLGNAGARLPDHLSIYHRAIANISMGYDDKLASICSSLRSAGITLEKAHQPLWIAAIDNTQYADKLPMVFVSLEKSGITNQEEHLPLVKCAIFNAEFAWRLSPIIDSLKEAGATLKDHLSLFKCAIKAVNNSAPLLELPGAYAALRAAGATIEEHQSLYKIIIKYAHVAFKIPDLVATLQAIGATIPKHLTIYEEIVKNVDELRPLIQNVHENNTASTNLADNLLTIFMALKAVGGKPQNQWSLYVSAINNFRYANKLPLAFTALQEIGATLTMHHSLYLAIIQNADYSENLSDAFATFRAAGITLENNRGFYEAITQNARHADVCMELFRALKETDLWPKLQTLIINQKTNHLANILDRLNQLDFKSPDDLDIILPALISNNPDILPWLLQQGFKKNDHRFVFELIFAGTNLVVQSPYTLSKVKNQLQHYLDDQSLHALDSDAWPAQSETLKNIINKVQEADNEITEGPLNKSDATKTTEAILKRISMENIENVNLRFDDRLGYILQFNNEPEIYLSELLKLTNFNHVTLSTDEIILLGNKIQDVAADFNSVGMLNNSSIVNKLPIPARYALTCYVDNKRYKNINRMFRGVAQTTAGEHVWIEPVEGRDNLIATFLTGCLVSWSAATLPHLLHDSTERQLLTKIALDACENQDLYKQQLKIKRTEGLINQDEYTLLKPLFTELSTFFPSYGLLDRGDEFGIAEEGGELCPKKRFTANTATFTPAILSLSVFPQGNDIFHPQGSTATKIETNNNRPVVNSNEGEILVAPGTSYRYNEDRSGTFFAREVNSPGIVPNGGFWSSTALAEAFKNHLSKAYADSSEQVSINNISIPRPNHGLAHSYRKMVYIDIVINYFAHHAVDPAFRLFCQTVSPEEREWLRVTAAYSVSGRESELSPHDNLEKYNQYKETGKANMEAFLDKYPPADPDEAMRERMLHGVRWLGNPNYEQGSGEHPTINTHPDQPEREHRNFIQRILCVAHNIDLPRCRNSEQFEEDMAICRRLSVESPEQKDDYTHMVDYAAQLIRAHGDSVGGYQSPFEKVSTNLRQLREVTESVTRPIVREPYQFTGAQYLPSVVMQS